MKEYNIVFEIPAAEDLRGIVDYIAGVLEEPETAQHMYFSIREQIETLRQMPYRNAVVNDEPYKSFGIRKLFVENYIAFYVVDEGTYVVHIIRILYNRREWQDLL